jgi:hypothetical protein
MEKKVGYAFLWLIFLFSGNSILCQNVQLYVKKGTALVNGRLVKAGQVSKIDKADELDVSPKSLAFILNENKIAELASGKNYKFKDLEGLTKSKEGYSKAFISVLTNQDYRQKDQSGISLRNTPETELWGFMPPDSFFVLAEKFNFHAGRKGCHFLSKIHVEGPSIKDSIPSADVNFEYSLKDLAPGEYSWTYQLACEGLTKSFKNVFSIPTQSERKVLIDKLNKFKGLLNGFSIEMQNQLTEEYKFQNRFMD